jgi:hypothetical protein
MDFGCFHEFHPFCCNTGIGLYGAAIPSCIFHISSILGTKLGFLIEEQVSVSLQ